MRLLIKLKVAVSSSGGNHVSFLEDKGKYFCTQSQKDHPYHYDSYDSQSNTQKYTQPKECRECSLREIDESP